MPKTVHVTLAGRQYPIIEKPIGVASVWRDRLRKSKAMQIFESLDVAMMQLVAVGDSITDEDGNLTSWANVNVSEVIGVAKILPVVVNGLASSILAAWGLVRGPQAAQTGRSLPSKNGASGQKQASHRKIA